MELCGAAALPTEQLPELVVLLATDQIPDICISMGSAAEMLAWLQDSKEQKRRQEYALVCGRDWQRIDPIPSFLEREALEEIIFQ